MSTTMFLTLTTIECANCGIPFGISADFEKRRREDHKGFMCPSGHSNVFPQETEAEKLKREVARLQTTVEHKEATISSLRDQRAALERSRAALRGVHTRTCNRVKNGVCPCCNRTFSNLANHMATKHPDFNAVETAK